MAAGTGVVCWCLPLDLLLNVTKLISVAELQKLGKKCKKTGATHRRSKAPQFQTSLLVIFEATVELRHGGGYNAPLEWCGSMGVVLTIV